MMQPRNPGREAVFEEAYDGTPMIPICMGGMAVEGAQASIRGCNDPSTCVPQLPTEQGKINAVVWDNETKPKVKHIMVVNQYPLAEGSRG